MYLSKMTVLFWGKKRQNWLSTFQYIHFNLLTYFAIILTKTEIKSIAGANYVRKDDFIVISIKSVSLMKGGQIIQYYSFYYF